MRIRIKKLPQQYKLNARKWKHGLGGHIFDGTSEPTQFMEEDRFATTQMPQLLVSAKRKYIAGYDKNGNPVYTENPQESMGYTPYTRERTKYQEWANRDKNAPKYTDAIVKAAQGLIGAPLATIAGAPVVEATMPVMEAMARPLTTTTRVGSRLFPGLSKALPYTEMADRGLMGYMGAQGMYDAGKGWYEGKMPWYQAVSQMGLSGLMMADAAPLVAKGLNKASTFMASPYTGKWTTVGNRQYRLSPNSLGANGVPVESRNTVQEINISPEELYKILQEQKDYYFLGHGTGRTNVAPETIFNSGLRVKNGEISNTTTPISETNLANWPHLNSEEIIILPGKIGDVKYDAAYGHIPSDWYSSNVFQWTDNPEIIGRGPFAARKPNATFVETEVNGVPGVYTKPEAVLGSYNTRTHTLRINPNSQYKFSFQNTTPTITPENAASITPEQWTAAQDAAIARGDMAEAQRLADLHMAVKAPDNFASSPDGMPLDLFHGTRTADGIKQNGFQKTMTGKGNRGAAQGNTYLTNNYDNAEYTGVKRHEIEPLIDKVTSVYDMFGTERIPTLQELNLELHSNYAKQQKLRDAASRIGTGSLADKIGTSLGIKRTSTNKKKALLETVNQLENEANELLRRSRVVGYLDDGLNFLSGDKSRASINTLSFIEEPVNPNSPFRQIAADRLINTLYGTQDLTYSPEVLRVHAYVKNPLIKDYEMQPTDVNPLMLSRFDPTLLSYNEKEMAKLAELSNPEYDAAITKNMFDVLFGDQYIIKDPRFIKSADAVTYDPVTKERVPLGDRHDFSKNDLNYSWLPWFLGGTSAATLASQKAYGGNLFSGEENHSSKMNQGHVYDVLPKLLRNAGLNIRVTSGYRKPGQAGKAGSKSWHTHHGAVDIVPQGKTTFEDIENVIYSDPVISRYMLDNGFGLLDESGRTAESKVTMKKTGATGAHFHIGKDSKPAAAYRNKMMTMANTSLPTSDITTTVPSSASMYQLDPRLLTSNLFNTQPLASGYHEQPLVDIANAYSAEQLAREERQNQLNALSYILGIGNSKEANSSILGIVSMLPN